MKEKIPTVAIIIIIALLWFLPIDLERERALANTGARKLLLYIFETTSLKIAITILLGFAILGFQSRDFDKDNEES